MITRTLPVVAKVGLHARPVALLAKIASDLATKDITVKIGSGEQVLVELGTDDENLAEEIFAQVAEALAAD